jgi:hypothetical protein
MANKRIEQIASFVLKLSSEERRQLRGYYNNAEYYKTLIDRWGKSYVETLLPILELAIAVEMDLADTLGVHLAAARAAYQGGVGDRSI